MSNISCNFALKTAFNAKYDLTWSFQYSLSGNGQASGGFSTFIYNNPTLVGGGDQNGLGFTSTTTMPGVSGAILGVGFDSSGAFSSRQYSLTTGTFDLSANTVGCRSGDYFTFKGLQSIPFNLIETEEVFRTLRFNLTDLGQTLHIDYKLDQSDQYTKLASFETGLLYTEDALVYIGIGVATPVLSGSNAICKIRDLHSHGIL